MAWWKYLLNIDTIAVIIITISVIYCLCTRKRRRKYEFQGFGINEEEGTPPKKREKRVNKHEERCREIFQKIFGQKFKSVRPDWLKNPVTGKNLELDGFCPNIRTPLGLGLAFEYDGEQHARYNSHFHRRGVADFVYQCKKDSWKDLKCKEQGVMLVRIPYFIMFEDLGRYITNKLDKLEILPSLKRERLRRQWTAGQHQLGKLSHLIG